MLKVLVVEQAASLLGQILRKTESLVVLTLDPEADIVEFCQQHQPQVVLQEASLQALDIVQTLMERHPVPCVLVARHPETFLRAGILAGAVSTTSLPRSTREVAALARHLKLMSEVLVIRRRRAPQLRRGRIRAVGLVASLGGPPAIAQVMSHLRGAQAIFLVVQHLVPDSVPGFADWLARCCPLPVQVARHNEQAQEGRVYLAASGSHLEFDGQRIHLTDSKPLSFQRPSGSVLLRSLARSLGSAAAGVILTGLGDDGARGLLELRAAGGYTLVEARSSATAFEMPAAALRLNPAHDSCPLEQIGPRLRTLLWSPEAPEDSES